MQAILRTMFSFAVAILLTFFGPDIRVPSQSLHKQFWKAHYLAGQLLHQLFVAWEQPWLIVRVKVCLLKLFSSVAWLFLTLLCLL